MFWRPLFPSPQLRTIAMIGAFAGLWLGGLIAIDLVETPAKFGVKGMDRSAAVELGQEVFHRFGMLEAAFAIAMLVFGNHGDAPSFLTAASFALTVLALGVSPELRRRLNRTLRALLPEDREKSETFRALHRLYVTADLAKMILLAMVLWRIIG
ncbi:MAG TPA: hypothetical protein VFJ58_07940 [Armatimonadota bacterium]|nr:hypothetical protein [Armatimonadota bacterium]